MKGSDSPVDASWELSTKVQLAATCDYLRFRLALHQGQFSSTRLSVRLSEPSDERFLRFSFSRPLIFHTLGKTAQQKTVAKDAKSTTLLLPDTDSSVDNPQNVG